VRAESLCVTRVNCCRNPLCHDEATVSCQSRQNRFLNLCNEPGLNWRRRQPHRQSKHRLRRTSGQSCMGFHFRFGFSLNPMANDFPHDAMRACLGFVILATHALADHSGEEQIHTGKKSDDHCQCRKAPRRMQPELGIDGIQGEQEGQCDHDCAPPGSDRNGTIENAKMPSEASFRSSAGCTSSGRRGGRNDQREFRSGGSPAAHATKVRGPGERSERINALGQQLRPRLEPVERGDPHNPRVSPPLSTGMDHAESRQPYLG